MGIKVVVLICCLLSGLFLYDAIQGVSSRVEDLLLEKEQLNWDLEDALREAGHLKEHPGSPQSQKEYDALIDNIRFRALIDLIVIGSLISQILLSLIIIFYRPAKKLVIAVGILLLVICGFHTHLFFRWFYQCSAGESILVAIINIIYLFSALYLFSNSNTGSQRTPKIISEIGPNTDPTP